MRRLPVEVAMNFLRDVDAARAAGTRGELLIHESGAFELSPSFERPPSPKKKEPPKEEDDWVLVES